MRSTSRRSRSRSARRLPVVAPVAVALEPRTMLSATPVDAGTFNMLPGRSGGYDISLLTLNTLTDATQQTINYTGSDPNIPFTQFRRFTNTGDRKNPNNGIVEPFRVRAQQNIVRKVGTAAGDGDQVVIEFWARGSTSDPQSVTSWAEVSVENLRKTPVPGQSLNPGYYNDFRQYGTRTIQADGTWRKYQISFDIDRYQEYTTGSDPNGAGSSLKFQIRLGNREQTFDIGGLKVMEDPSGVTGSPDTGQTYVGRESDAAWRTTAQNEINANRKANLTVTVEDQNGDAIQGAEVAVRMQRHAFGFGAQVGSDFLGITQSDFNTYKDELRGVQSKYGYTPDDIEWSDILEYRDHVKENYNKVTLTSTFWSNWENANGRQEQWLRNAMQWLADNEIEVKGHPAASAYINPGNAWIHKGDQADRPGDRLIDRMIEHIEDIVPDVPGQLLRNGTNGSGFGTSVSEWDALNHPINRTSNDTGPADSLTDRYGFDSNRYILERIRDLEPTVERWINENNVLPGGERADAYYDFIDQLLNLSVPGELRFDSDGDGDITDEEWISAGDPQSLIDGIGFMAHFNVRQVRPPEELLAEFDRFASFGKKLQITEFDLSVGGDEGLRYDYVRDFLTAAFSHEAMDSIVQWGFWEPTHWITDRAPMSIDWNGNAAHQAYRDLVYGEWWTDTTANTNGSGVATVNGFKGDYEIVVTYQGQDYVIDAATPNDLHQMRNGNLSVTATLPIVASGLPILEAETADDGSGGNVITNPSAGLPPQSVNDPGASGGAKLGYIQNGDSVTFKNVNFSQNARSLLIEYGAPSNQQPISIKVKIGNGPEETFGMSRNNGVNDFSINPNARRLNITDTGTGVKDVKLTFVGGGGAVGNYLYDIDRIVFDDGNGGFDPVTPALGDVTDFVARWTFDGTLNETTGNPQNLDGEVVNSSLVAQTANYAGGQIGQAVNLNGSTFVDVPNSNGSLLEAQFDARTISFWFRADNAGNGGGQVLYEEGGGTNGLAVRVIGNDLEAAVRTGGAGSQETLTFADAITNGQWYHVAAVYDDTGAGNDGAGTFRIYLDGGTPLTTATGFDDILGHGSDPGIGGRNGGDAFGGGGQGAFFDGRIDDVRIYDRAVSGAEVAAIVTAGGGAGGSQPSTDLNLALDAVTDRAGNGSGWGTSGGVLTYNGGNNYGGATGGGNGLNATDNTYTFNAPTAGLYTVWLKVDTNGNGGQDDSVWVKIDGADVGQSVNLGDTGSASNDGGDDWVKFNAMTPSTSPQWRQVHNSDAGGNPVQFYLTAGTKTLRVAGREDGIAIDEIFVTNTGVTPGSQSIDRANSTPQAEVVSLAASDLDTRAFRRALGAAQRSWRRAGYDVREFRDNRVVVKDLGDDRVAAYADDVIYLDDDAAGFGWFVDETPFNSNEFKHGGSPAGVDLVSVLTHELGHDLGFGEGTGVMDPFIATGERTSGFPVA